ncbi:PqqD family protein [Denitratimonas sp. CY0512]|uniref:PqqD family protein n=1 Tax=Denitratimonas sp. CY0512 TaxID=3131940 RepID=UPI0030988639
MDIPEFARRIEEGHYGVTLLPDGTGVLLDLNQEALISFNATGAFILSCLRERMDESQVVAALIERFEVDDLTAGQDVPAFIAQLADAVGM